jgi:hypothetical protein
MPREPLSDHCSLMKHPERSVLPSDCPKDASYIKTGDQGSDSVLHPITPFPLVIEGGEGNDKVTVIGTPKNPVLIDGGKGNDTVVVQNESARVAWAHVAARMSPEGLLFLGVVLIVFSAIGALGWRALTSKGAGGAG